TRGINQLLRSCGQPPLHRPGGPIRSSSIAPPKPINQNSPRQILRRSEERRVGKNQADRAGRKIAEEPGRFLARPISLASYPVATASPLPRTSARLGVSADVSAADLNAGHQPAVAIVRPAAAAPPRRPDPVEQHRAAETNKPKFSAPDSS